MQQVKLINYYVYLQEHLGLWRDRADVWHHIETHGVPYNPLHDAFMPSIGCAPCTRAISVSEDFRAGRWWWEDEAQKECGLHVREAAELAAEPA